MKALPEEVKKCAALGHPHPCEERDNQHARWLQCAWCGERQVYEQFKDGMTLRRENAPPTSSFQGQLSETPSSKTVASDRSTDEWGRGTVCPRKTATRGEWYDGVLEL